MKKFTIFIVSIWVMVILNGCGGSTVIVTKVKSDATTLFLVDAKGYSYGGVPYKCDSMSSWSKTTPNGEFTFYPPDNCQFDFTGLNGTTSNDPDIDDVIYIVDTLDNGKNNIPYECNSFEGVNHTYNDGIGDGSFDYAPNDSCVFYL